MKDNIEFICKYLTGEVTKEDFVSEYKKQVTKSPKALLFESESFSQCVEDTLLTQGTALSSYAHENNFPAKMRLKLRSLSNNDCSDKLIDALVDVSYSPKDNGVLRECNFSSFSGYKVNTGEPALRALKTLYKGSEFDWGKEIIEDRLGKNNYTPNWLSEGIREDMARWGRVNDANNVAVFKETIQNA